MNVLYIALPQSVAAGWEERFRALRASGIEPIAVSGLSELRERLGDADCGGMLHILGGNAMSPAEVVALAEEFPTRLAIIAGSARGVTKEFMSVLRPGESERLVVLEEFEDVAAEVRRRIPCLLARRWVREVLRPVIEERLAAVSADDRRLVDWLLNDCSVAGKAPGGARLSKSDLKRLNTLLKGAGLQTAHAIHAALQLLVYCIAVSRVGLSTKQAVAVSGLTDSRDICRRAAQVLRVGDIDRVHGFTVEEVAERWDRAPMLATARSFRDLTPRSSGTRLRLGWMGF